ncbi:hypothetical protein KC19_4G181300 [Ceratodon purpureus]|uniref:Uncharacterized protein n=1 Tax=Ceratodon purpureus TaxID=3225 RepID=A0A8T0IDK3_CERPU|nr:hypothetical protein KC19_4G181300 [Ceratodon purpureus]
MLVRHRHHRRRRQSADAEPPVITNWRLVVSAIFLASPRWHCGGRLESGEAVRRSFDGAGV